MRQSRRGPELTGPSRQADLRLVPVALAGWAAAWLGTWATAGSWALAGGGAAAALVLARLRHSSWMTAAAVVTAVLCITGGLHAHRLGHGPVADLARAGAVVEVQLEVRTDARVVTARGGRADYAVARATVLRIAAAGSVWRVRVPGLVVVGGENARDWVRLPVGSRITAWARLQSPDRGSDVAAVVRLRGEPILLAGPSPPLQLVERVRAGLRVSVAGRAAEPRALVPALVVGDTSAMTADLEEKFKATGLTHVTVK